jgi:hypothetical protein
MMKIFIALAISAIPCVAMAQSNATEHDSYVSGTFATTTACVSAAIDDCTKSDLVIESHNTTMLIRGIYGCQSVASKLQASSEVFVAKCFH